MQLLESSGGDSSASKKQSNAAVRGCFGLLRQLANSDAVKEIIMADSGLDLVRAAADGCISASAGLHNRLLDSKIKDPPTCSEVLYMVLTVTKGKPLLCRRLKRSFLSYREKVCHMC